MYDMDFLGTATLLYFFYLFIVNIIAWTLLLFGLYASVTNYLGEVGEYEMG
jgi:hypothetical protein